MKNADAYFTVEAALVLPVLMGAILFVIYILFFQYDRCLLEQDLGAMALWGSRLEESGQERLEEKVQERVRGLYKEKYMAWDFAVLEASLEKNTFSANILLTNVRKCDIFILGCSPYRVKIRDLDFKKLSKSNRIVRLSL